jgi:hypothetical protein
MGAHEPTRDELADRGGSLAERLRFGCPFKPYSKEDGIAAYDVSKAERVMLEAADRVERIEGELAAQKASAPLCEEHRPNGGTRGGCLVCAVTRLSAALSRISYACEEPNDYQCSSYDAHCNEDAVVVQVAVALADAHRDIARLLSIVRKAALGSGALRDEAHAVLKELGEL